MKTALGLATSIGTVITFAAQRRNMIAKGNKLRRREEKEKEHLKAKLYLSASLFRMAPSVTPKWV
jgi:hypothetical protein